jgi:type IV pilus assembly protein PilV
MRIDKQKGVGLLEVLVALLILSIAVLGFALMQLKAVDATAEGFNRIQAMNIARDLAEKMRINHSEAALARYQLQLSTTSNQATSVDCYNNFCSAANKAIADVHEAYLQAQVAGMRINMLTCPNAMNDRQCIYVAWAKTDPTNNSATTDGHSACTSSTTSQFSYENDSSCIVMEAY